MATVAAELEVPDGVIVEAVAVPAGWKYEAKRKDDGIVASVFGRCFNTSEWNEPSYLMGYARSASRKDQRNPCYGDGQRCDVRNRERP